MNSAPGFFSQATGAARADTVLHRDWHHLTRFANQLFDVGRFHEAVSYYGEAFEEARKRHCDAALTGERATDAAPRIIVSAANMARNYEELGQLDVAAQVLQDVARDFLAVFKSGTCAVEYREACLGHLPKLTLELVGRRTSSQALIDISTRLVAALKESAETLLTSEMTHISGRH